MSNIVPDVASAQGATGAMSTRITRDSLWLMSGFGVTAATGFLYWILAARLIPPEQLGIDTALLSIVTACAALAASGLGNAFLVMLPVAGVDRATLLRRGMFTAVALAGVLGTVGVCWRPLPFRWVRARC